MHLATLDDQIKKVYYKHLLNWGRLSFRICLFAPFEMSRKELMREVKRIIDDFPITTERPLFLFSDNEIIKDLYSSDERRISID